MVRITKQADYGLVLMTYFANMETRAFTALELSARARLPRPTVSKILKLLTKSGLLQSQRGMRGGYRLARSARLITIADIIESLDGPIAITECGTHAAGCDREPFCPVRTNWRFIDDAVRNALSEISLDAMSQPFSGPKVFMEPMRAEVRALISGATG